MNIVVFIESDIVCVCLFTAQIVNDLKYFFLHCEVRACSCSPRITDLCTNG